MKCFMHGSQITCDVISQVACTILSNKLLTFVFASLFLSHHALAHQPLVQPGGRCVRLRSGRRGPSGAASGDARSREPCERHCRCEAHGAGPAPHHEAVQGRARGLRRRRHVPRPRKPHTRTGKTAPFVVLLLLLLLW